LTPYEKKTKMVIYALSEKTYHQHSTIRSIVVGNL
jgi:hypothetical protein